MHDDSSTSNANVLLVLCAHVYMHAFAYMHIICMYVRTQVDAHGHKQVPEPESGGMQPGSMHPPCHAASVRVRSLTMFKGLSS